MSFQAKVISPDGNLINIDPLNGKTFELDELQKIVGGYIEIITPPGNTGAIMIVNEDGKLKGLPLNPVATQMWQEGCDPGSDRSFDTVVGDGGVVSSVAD